MSGADDLSGDWRGIFNYPNGAAPPTEFTAILRDSGGLLTGETAEPSPYGGTLAARLDGRRAGTAVTFNKLYDRTDEGGFDSVAYRGEVDGEGLEITGRWTIAENWSGTFIMVRERGVEEKEAEAAVEEPVRSPASAATSRTSPPASGWKISAKSSARARARRSATPSLPSAAAGAPPTRRAPPP